MADYVVDFLLGTGEMKQVLNESRRNAGTGLGTQTGGFGGRGLKVAGIATIIGILSQMKIVQDTLSFLMTTLSTGISFLVSMFVQWITPFFKDPTRFLLELYVDQANMIITVLEFMTNAILGALTFGQVGGFGENEIEFPRFQKDIILDAYDNMTSVIQDSESGIDDIAKATIDFTTSFVDSFMTNTEYANLLEDSASESFGNIVNSINKTGGLADTISNAYDRTKEKLDRLFSSYESSRQVNIRSANVSTNDKRSALEITRQYNQNLNFSEE